MFQLVFRLDSCDAYQKWIIIKEHGIAVLVPGCRH